MGTSSSASAPGSTIDTSNEGHELGSGRFCGLQFTDTGVNARNIFLAARFLSERLPEILYTAVKDEAISLTRDGKTFKKLAADLEKAEPSLGGVTGIALYSTYDRLVQHYHHLAFLEVATGDVTIKTILMDHVEQLHNMDADFLQMKQKMVRVEGL